MWNSSDFLDDFFPTNTGNWRFELPLNGLNAEDKYHGVHVRLYMDNDRSDDSSSFVFKLKSEK